MPDTSTAFHLAYIVAAVIYGGYSFFLWRRARKLRARRAELSSPNGGRRA